MEKHEDEVKAKDERSEGIPITKTRNGVSYS